METIKKQVKDLHKGDDLGNCLILGDPIMIGEYYGQKNRMSIAVRFPDGKESIRIWGKYTTVSVKRLN